MYKDVGHKQVPLALRRETNGKQIERTGKWAETTGKWVGTTGKRVETIRNNW